MEKIDEEDIDCFLLKMERIREQKENQETDMGEWHRFSECLIWIPAVFRPADGESAADIFWSENRPETMFLTEGRTEGITLQELEETDFLWKEGAENPLEQVRKMLGKLDDRTVFYDMGTEEDAVKVHWLEYKSFAADERVYNVMFLFRTGEKEILGTFFCPFGEYDRWKAAVWKMMQTIRIADEEWEDTDERA